MSEIPDEIKVIRQRLAEIEELASGRRDFNDALRQASRRNEVAPDELNQRIRNPKNTFTITEETDK